MNCDLKAQEKCQNEDRIRQHKIVIEYHPSIRYSLFPQP